MSPSPSLRPTTCSDTQRLSPGAAACERIDLLTLIQRVAKGSREALDELVSHRHPVLHHGRAIRLPDWIETQATRPASVHNWGDEVLEAARDLLYDRFTRLPIHPDGGIDCRYYHQGFINHYPPPPPELIPGYSDALGVSGAVPNADGESGAMPRLSIQKSAEVQHRLTGYLHRHWRLCLREAWRRQQRMTVAHTCSIDGVLLRLWVPASIACKQRSDWVVRNFGPIDTRDASSRDRVQSSINDWLDHALRERERHLHAACQSDALGTGGTGLCIEQSWSQHGLAKTVAAEKSSAPNRLRVSIAALGSNRIEQMVTRIFEDISDGCYHPSATAKEFGLHKSTLTRFAAVRWQPGDNGPIPDLWLNTAQVLARQPQFAAALEEAGLEDLVQTLGSNTPEHG